MSKILKLLTWNAVALYAPSLPFALYVLAWVEKTRPFAGGLLISAPATAILALLGERGHSRSILLLIGAAVVAGLLTVTTSVAVLRPAVASRSRFFLFVYSICNLVGSILAFMWIDSRGRQH